MDYCYGCMEKSTGDKVCPRCGYEVGTQPESPMHLKPGTILNGKYMLGRVLGHGGFGITYLAVDINLGVKLAIKEYLPQGVATRAGDTSAISVYSGDSQGNFEYGLEKFLDEARTLAIFDDVPEIVIAKDFFKENGTAYLVMSYIDGITLKEYIEQKGGRLSVEETLSFILPVMKALENVHKEGVLHRDISPDNIYITKKYNVKLLDFGAARFSMGEHSKSLSVLLKPGYAPEEQYRTRGKQGPWTDVYALAATMYKMLTGVTPPESLDRFEEDILKSPAELGIGVPEEVWLSMKKALSIRAVDRYQTVTEFYNDIVKPGHDSKQVTQEANMTAKKTPEIQKPVKGSDMGMPGSKETLYGNSSPINSLSTAASNGTYNHEAEYGSRYNKNKKRLLITVGVIIGIMAVLILWSVTSGKSGDSDTTASGGGDKPVVQRTNPIKFHNTIIETAVRKIINKTEGEVYPKDVEEIRDFGNEKLTEQNITDISDLKWLVNLEKIDLAKNNISDITPLSGLKNLTSINLQENQIKDLSPLANMSQLNYLQLEENIIEDVTPLSNLTNLTELWLYGNKITDVSPLKNLTGLKTLGLGKNQISDITPLSNLTNLQSLYLSGNQITDWSPVANVGSVDGRP